MVWRVSARCHHYDQPSNTKRCEVESPSSLFYQLHRRCVCHWLHSLAIRRRVAYCASVESIKLTPTLPSLPFASPPCAWLVRMNVQTRDARTRNCGMSADHHVRSPVRTSASMSVCACGHLTNCSYVRSSVHVSVYACVCMSSWSYARPYVVCTFVRPSMCARTAVEQRGQMKQNESRSIVTVTSLSTCGLLARIITFDMRSTRAAQPTVARAVLRRRKHSYCDERATLESKQREHKSDSTWQLQAICIRVRRKLHTITNSWGSWMLTSTRAKVKLVTVTCPIRVCPISSECSPTRDHQATATLELQISLPLVVRLPLNPSSEHPSVCTGGERSLGFQSTHLNANTHKCAVRSTQRFESRCVFENVTVN